MISNILFNMYKINNFRIKRMIRSLICRIENGEYHSDTLRKIFKTYHNVEVGKYTHGGCFVPFQVDKFTTIGRYCSIARQVRIMNRNHSMHFKSTHAMFSIATFGLCEKDLLEHSPLIIENDVWIGHNAIVMPHVGKIENGAVIGAGTVVNKNIPPYAVVVGNPGRIVRYRFSKEVIEKLLESKWWQKSLDELKKNIVDFQKPLETTKDD